MDLVLHHYAGSPFSEKVRLVFGLKKLAWRSVDVPVMLPKPDVVALTGGYRRTPFLQIGADVYCDSALMCRVIDRLHPAPPLYPGASAGLADIVAQWADQSLFWAAVPFTMQPAGIGHVFKGAPLEFVKAFGADRAAMNPGMRRAPLHDQAASLQAYVGRLESMLGDGRAFLLGEAPSIADVAAAQSIWFVRRAPPVAATIAMHARTGAWYERVAAFGHGERAEMSSADALALARATHGFAPTEVDAEGGIARGSEVTVTPADYAHDDVAGTLVGLARDSVTIERSDPRAGTLHVHFPRVGYHVRPLKKDPA